MTFNLGPHQCCITGHKYSDRVTQRTGVELPTASYCAAAFIYVSSPTLQAVTVRIPWECLCSYLDCEIHSMNLFEDSMKKLNVILKMLTGGKLLS